MHGRAVYLPGLLLLTFSLYSSLDATHRWYSVLAVMAAVALLIEKRTYARLAVAGLLFGVASFFTYPRPSQARSAPTRSFDSRLYHQTCG